MGPWPEEKERKPWNKKLQFELVPKSCQKAGRINLCTLSTGGMDLRLENEKSGASNQSSENKYEKRGTYETEPKLNQNGK